MTIWLLGKSKVKTVVLGLVGTFLVNIFRITGVAVVAFYLSQQVATVVHDYGSTLSIMAWLFGFWWFAHEFVLSPKKS